MAEQGAPQGGGKILGLRPRTALIASGVVLAGALAWFWWRRKSSAQPSVTSASAGTGAYGVDYSGELSTIQAELEQLLAAQGVPAGGGGPPGGPGGGGSGGGGQGGGGVSTGGGQPPVTGGPPGQAKPGTPTGAHATKVNANSVTLAWNKAPNAASYRVRVTYQGKLVTQQSVSGTSATISGLHPDHTYTFHVASVGPGGVSAETNGPAVKTAR